MKTKLTPRKKYADVNWDNRKSKVQRSLNVKRTDPVVRIYHSTKKEEVIVGFNWKAICKILGDKQKDNIILGFRNRTLFIAFCEEHEIGAMGFGKHKSKSVRKSAKWLVKQMKMPVGTEYAGLIQKVNKNLYKAEMVEYKKYKK